MPSTEGLPEPSSRPPSTLTTAAKPLSLRKFVTFGFFAAVVPVLLLFQTTLLHPSTLYIGENQDSVQFMWYLGWFWHAILHVKNPLQTSLLNFPVGLNLMRNTSIAAEALWFGPLFSLFNPVLAFNLAFAAGVMLTGIAGMILLRQLHLSRWLAIGGGILLELAPYLTAQSADGHINLIWSPVFVIASLAVIARIVLTSVRHTRLLGMLFGILMSMLFYTSAEVFATYAFMALLSLFVWAIFAPGRVYRIVKGIPIPFVAWCCVIMLVAITPGLYAFFDGAQISSMAKTLMPVGVFVTDLFNPVLPTSVYLLHVHTTSVLTDLMTGDLSEKGGYLGVPTIVILYWAIRKLWTSQFYRGLSIIFFAIFILSLGPTLHILGITTPLPLPWMLLQYLPLMRDALPSRLMFYDDVIAVILIVAAVQAALQTARPERRKKTLRLSVFAMLTVALLWLPRVDFAKQSIPPVPSSLKPTGKIYGLIENQPTTLITKSYFDGAYFMGLAAQLDFKVPFTNVYGFPYTSEFLAPAAGQLLKTNSIYTSAYASLTQKEAAASVKKFVKQRHPHFILDAAPYSPALPAQLSQALNRLYGTPYIAHGVKLWNTKK